MKPLINIAGRTRTIGEAQGYIGLALADGKTDYWEKLIEVVLKKHGINPEGRNLKQMKYDLFGRNAAVKDAMMNDSVTGPGTPVMTSFWRISEEEMIAGPLPVIKLDVLGTQHPPVMLSPVYDETELLKGWREE
jgi:hypothetical protein